MLLFTGGAYAQVKAPNVTQPRSHCWDEYYAGTITSRDCYVYSTRSCQVTATSTTENHNSPEAACSKAAELCLSEDSAPAAARGFSYSFAGTAHATGPDVRTLYCLMAITNPAIIPPSPDYQAFEVLKTVNNWSGTELSCDEGWVLDGGSCRPDGCPTGQVRSTAANACICAF